MKLRQAPESFYSHMLHCSNHISLTLGGPCKHNNIYLSVNMLVKCCVSQALPGLVCELRLSLCHACSDLFQSITWVDPHCQTQLKPLMWEAWLKPETASHRDEALLYHTGGAARTSVSVLTGRRRRFLPLVSVCESDRSRERITGEGLSEGERGETAHGWWAGCCGEHRGGAEQVTLQHTAEWQRLAGCHIRRLPYCHKQVTWWTWGRSTVLHTHTGTRTTSSYLSVFWPLGGAWWTENNGCTFMFEVFFFYGKGTLTRLCCKFQSCF